MPYPKPRIYEEIITPEKRVQTSFRMIEVLGGDFLMGCENEDADDDEMPIHLVEVNSFWMGEFPVTQKLWQAVMDENPSYFLGADRPVERVSWLTINNQFLPLLNEMSKQSYRLPTEAEWEYAALGGVFKSNYKHVGSNRLKDIGWFKENSHGETKPVGLKQPNVLSLYDMNGNVLEWCIDHWHDNYEHAPNTGGYPWTYTGGDHGHILRGGAWNYPAKDYRISFRHASHAEDAEFDFGFRLVMSELK